MDPDYQPFDRTEAQGICHRSLVPRLEFFTEGFETWLTNQPATVYLKTPNLVARVLLPAEILGEESPRGLPAAAGLPVVVKRFGWRSPLHRLAGRLTPSKGIRAIRIALILRRAGVRTPKPLIAWDRRHGRGPTVSYYITREIPDAISVRSILTESGPAIGPHLERLARLVRGMHDAGIFHRDLTLGNFLVESGSDSREAGPGLIDLSRAIHLPRVPLPIRLIDLARMNLKDSWPPFYEIYCEGRPSFRRGWPILRLLIALRRGKMALWKKIRAATAGSD